MKTRRILVLLLSVLMAASAIGFVTLAAEEGVTETGGAYISFNYSDVCNGVVNSAPNAKVEKNVQFQGVDTVKITPTPLEATGSSLTLDSYSLHKQELKVEIPKYKYVGVTYYYETDSPTFQGKMGFTIRPGTSNKVIVEKIDKSATKDIVTNQWAEAIFNFNEIQLNPEAVKNYLQQVNLRPFGGLGPKTLTENDVMYISKLTFYETHPDPNAKTTIEFLKGDPTASGTDITFEVKMNEKYTLPENPYTYENATFLGWVSSEDGKTYPAGTEMTAGEMDVEYSASWKVQKIYPDFISIDFTDYQRGIVNGRTTATVEQVEKDGRNVVKVTPNPAYVEEGVTTITVDGYEYDKAGIDMSTYNWFTVEYFYESPAPVSDMKHVVRVYTGGTKIIAPDKPTSLELSAENTIVSGSWATSTFNLAPLKEVLDPAKEEHILDQMHFRVYGAYDFHGLTSNDVMYVSRLVFYKEKPVQDTHDSYMTGYADGNFLPGGNMTRAEACTVIARILEKEENIAGASAFADVPQDAWYAKYIGFCEAKGLLNSYSGNFYPDRPITRADFTELVYLTGLAKATDKVVSFADLDGGHAKHEAIIAAASAGLINGYDTGNGTYIFRPDNTITRAEVVTIINRARGRSRTQADITEDIILVFLDVDDSHWAFADIAEAAVPHTEKDSKWLYPLSDPLIAIQEKLDPNTFFDIAGGNAKVAELDIYEAQRISEIRNTPNMDLSAITGNKVYVSSSMGDDENDGLSEATPVKTFAKANTIVTAGGAVLLKRGDLWREQLVAKANTTYTAYGEGTKPKVYGSPENGADPAKWTLVYENKETGALIWKYEREDFIDVGMIVLNNGEGFGLKEIPSYNGKEFLVRNDTTKVFNYTIELDKNFEFFHAANSVMTNGVRINESSATGPLYFRCDNGNPGKVFDSIEFNIRKAAVSCLGSNITVDNLRLMYSNFGISVAADNQIFTNLEIGWIGGCVFNYDVSGNIAKASRYGNGIEVFGRCDNYVIDNCHIYQCYDAGITHQSGSSVSGGDVKQDNIRFVNNVLTDSVYNIEYFLGHDDKNVRTSGTNILYEGNLCRRAGYGFGSTRPSVDNQRHIRSGYSENQFYNFVIKNNIFDRAVHELTWTYSKYEACVPVFEGNTYIQGLGNRLFETGSKKTVAYADVAGRYHIRNTLGDKTASIYFVENIPKYVYTYTNDKKVEVTDEERAATEEYVKEHGVPGKEQEGPIVEETTEVFKPLIVCTQKDGNLYKDTRDSYTVGTAVDPDTGIVYANIRLQFNPAILNMDCHNLSPRMPVDETGNLYFKVLLRTNKQYKPFIKLYNVKDAGGTALATGQKAESFESTVGNGEWEQLIIKIEGVPKKSTVGQIHFNFAGQNVTGASHFDDDGNLTSDAYYHIAAWAAFTNRASAEAYDLVKDVR